MQGNSSLFRSPSGLSQSSNKVTSSRELSEHDTLIFEYLVNDEHMKAEEALQKIQGNDPDVMELRIIESPQSHPLRK